MNEWPWDKSSDYDPYLHGSGDCGPHLPTIIVIITSIVLFVIGAGLFLSRADQGKQPALKIENTIK